MFWEWGFIGSLKGAKLIGDDPLSAIYWGELCYFFGKIYGST